VVAKGTLRANMTPPSKLIGELKSVFNVASPIFIFIFRKKAQDALWFAETYGLLPESLMLRDKTGLLHEINLKKTPTGK